MRKTKVWAFILAMGLSGVMSNPVSAKNNTDTKLPNTTIGYKIQEKADTEYRAKEDSSSNYINNKSGFNLHVVVIGSDATRNCTVGNYAIIPTAQRLIRNMVYEWGYRSCKLRVRTAKSGITGTLKGVWSPDSLGTYPRAN